MRGWNLAKTRPTQRRERQKSSVTLSARLSSLLEQNISHPVQLQRVCPCTGPEIMSETLLMTNKSVSPASSRHDWHAWQISTFNLSPCVRELPSLASKRLFLGNVGSPSLQVLVTNDETGGASSHTQVAPTAAYDREGSGEACSILVS